MAECGEDVRDRADKRPKDGVVTESLVPRFGNDLFDLFMTPLRLFTRRTRKLGKCCHCFCKGLPCASPRMYPLGIGQCHGANEGFRARALVDEALQSRSHCSDASSGVVFFRVELVRICKRHGWKIAGSCAAGKKGF